MLSFPTWLKLSLNTLVVITIAMNTNMEQGPRSDTKETTFLLQLTIMTQPPSKISKVSTCTHLSKASGLTAKCTVSLRAKE